MSTLRISLLGPMLVSRDSVTVTGFGANAAPALLVRQAKLDTLVTVSGVDVMFAGAHHAERICSAKKAPKPRSRLGGRLWARRAEASVVEVAPPVPSPNRLRGGAVRGESETKSPVQGTESPFQGRGSNF